jgi:hypothetical protein
MEIVVIVVGLLALLWFRQYRQALKVTHLRAVELSTVTGIPAEEIEREILRRRITPGDWAREHELDPLTFRSRTARTVGERALPDPDWSEVSELIPGAESRIASCSGWTVSLTDPIDHPVSLYLTDSALYISVRPQTIRPKAEARRWPRIQVVGCDSTSQPGGGIRLMIAFRGTESESTSLVSLGVVLRPVERASEFADQVVWWFNEGDQVSDEDLSPPPPPQPAPAEPLQRRGRLPSRPDGR